MTNIGKLIGLASAAGLLVGATANADVRTDDEQLVRVSSLQVKERLRSIEQINVTSEKQVLDIEPDSLRVQALLEEADELDELDAQPDRTPQH